MRRMRRKTHPTVDISSLHSVQRRVRDLQSRRCGHFSERKRQNRVYRRRKSAAGDFSESAVGSPGAAGLAAGDLLIMMTDGVLDALEDDCEERMRVMMRDIRRTESAGDRQRRYFLMPYAAVGAGLRDDMTVFVLCLWENA